MNNIFIEYLPPWVETGLQPAFYDKESGTVLQQTARMYAKVHELTQAFNDLSEETKSVVDEYTAKFIELHDYVHDYFDNLDVQEEINNKLDAMVESGDLQQIIEEYLNSIAIFGFDDVASMKDGTTLVDGSYAKTLGYYNVNDGGSAVYKITSSTPLSGHYETLNNGKYAVLITNGEVVNAVACGVNPDGTTDNASLINSLLATYPKLKLNGDIKIESPITLTSGMALIGDGNHKLILDDDSACTIRITGDNIVIKNLIIETTTDSYSNDTKCIEMVYGNNCVIENNELRKAYHGIKINPNDNTAVRDLQIKGNNIHTVKSGIYFGNANTDITFSIENVVIDGNNIHDGVGVVDPSSLNNGIKISRLSKNVTISNNIIHDMKADGVDGYKSGDSLIITGNQIYHNGECAIELKDGSSYADVTWGYAKNCIISNNIFYGHPSVDVNINSVDASKQYYNTVIKDNLFKNGVNGVRVSSHNVEISGNIFENYSSAGVLLYDANTLNVYYKNISVHDNLFKEATFRVTQTYYYCIVRNNCFVIANESLEPIYSASSYATIGDNQFITDNLPFVKSSAHILRPAERFVTIPFKFEGISESTTLTFKDILPKFNKKVQIIGGYLLSHTATNTNNLTCGVKVNTVNYFYLSSNTAISADTPLPLRPSTSNYDTFTDKLVDVTVTSDTNLSGYVVLYYIICE